MVMVVMMMMMMMDDGDHDKGGMCSSAHVTVLHPSQQTIRHNATCTHGQELYTHVEGSLLLVVFSRCSSAFDL